MSSTGTSRRSLKKKEGDNVSEKTGATGTTGATEAAESNPCYMYLGAAVSVSKIKKIKQFGLTREQLIHLKNVGSKRLCCRS
jgi:hypothetical protein